MWWNPAFAAFYPMRFGTSNHLLDNVVKIDLCSLDRSVYIGGATVRSGQPVFFH